MTDLITRMEFYSGMLKANIFTRSALAIAFCLLYRHLNGRTGRCDPSKKAIDELRESGWWQIDQGVGRGHKNSYLPQLEKVNVGSPIGAGKGEPQFTLFVPEKVNGRVRKGELQFTRTSKNQNPTVDLHRPPARSDRSRVRQILGREGATSEFETFWRIYPHRGEFSDPKKPARAKFEAAVECGVDPGVIIAGAERYRAHVERQGTEPRFRAQAQTWLNQERWAQLHEAEPARLRVGMN
jgi:hypothetical protein